MASSRSPHHYLNRHGRYGDYDDDDDEDDDDNYNDDGDANDDDDHKHPVDKIRRSFKGSSVDNGQNQAGASTSGTETNTNFRSMAASAAHAAAKSAAAWKPMETFEVRLDEGYFGAERRMLRESIVNLRSKVSSMRLFNPVDNSKQKLQVEEGLNEKEKYTLNEIKGSPDEKYQWNQPGDGREVWPSKMQYFLAITSYSIGLGNVIRFPILVQKNGGLAFIIPFLSMLVLEGIPLLYLELAIGQRMRKAAISCWNSISPVAAGIGLASAAVSFVIGLYYNTMVAWTLVYLANSLISGAKTKPLPFTICPEAVDSKQHHVVGSMLNSTKNQATTQIGPAEECQITGPFQYFWYKRTLNISGNVNDWSGFNWEITFCLAAAWTISYFCLVRGLFSSRRIVFIASIFPYVILVAFFIKVLFLNGTSDGVYYLLEPDWPKLYDPYIWLQAAAQVFFSLGLGFGGLIALSSYNPVNNNCYKDAVRVSIVNFCTSIFAGIVIFAILGFKANINHTKCQIEREKQIDYYLADYNLKVLDFGSVFKQVPANDVVEATTNSGGSLFRDDKDNSNDANNKIISELKTSNDSVGSSKDNNANDNTESGVDDETSSNDDYEYNSDDAIASIRSLDRQLDQALPPGTLDNIGDGDAEFTIDAKPLISPKDLDKIIENIPNLKVCSIRNELNEATQGNGLVFVVLTEALSQFEDNDKMWAILFFLMILTLGLDSQFGNLEGLLSSMTDLNTSQDGSSNNHNNLADNNNINNNDLHLDGQIDINSLNNRAFFNRKSLTGIICISSLIISIVFFAHGAGSYMFAIFDEYAGSFSLVLIALFELFAISYIYGLQKFADDCELMTGKRPHFVILLSWRYISPILLLIVILGTVRQFSQEITYQAWSESGQLETRIWPDWCILFGIVLILCCIIWIPLIAILKIFNITIIHEKQSTDIRLFPVDELREYHDLQEEHKSTKLERVLFGFYDED